MFPYIQRIQWRLSGGNHDKVKFQRSIVVLRPTRRVKGIKCHSVFGELWAICSFILVIREAIAVVCSKPEQGLECQFKNLVVAPAGQLVRASSWYAKAVGSIPGRECSPQSGHTQEAASECTNKWSNTSMSRSLSLSLSPSLLPSLPPSLKNQLKKG